MSTGDKTDLAYEFGPFRLDPAERLLLRDGQAVALTPKAFDLLVYLVEHHGHLVEKQSLMTALWPDTVVEEANLAYNVSALRKALGDGREDGRFIETVPTRGYRFVARVTVSSTRPSDCADEGVGVRRERPHSSQSTNGDGNRGRDCAYRCDGSRTLSLSQPASFLNERLGCRAPGSCL